MNTRRARSVPSAAAIGHGHRPWLSRSYALDPTVIVAAPASRFVDPARDPPGKRGTVTRAPCASSILARSLLIAVAAMLTVAPARAAAVATPAALRMATPAPKVVIVVGPAGVATDRYRREARAAAAVARRLTPNVVEIASPNATWPVVRAALQGASVVVYMGHGNGWPSRYRDALHPPTQDGFGLNPVAGVDDDAHQYVGEGPIGAQVRLAPNAIVLLHHLCYASGLSEPGLPEGTLDVARQRVDDYAAGFIAAGAGAVIAEADAPASTYIEALLRGPDRPIDALWRSAPSANGHVVTFASRRRAGFAAALDPVGRTSGFWRSLVVRPGLTVGQVRAGAGARPGGSAGPGAGAGSGVGASRAAPTLIGSGVTFGLPYLDGPTTAGASVRLHLPAIGALAREVGAGMSVGVGVSVGLRWLPLDRPSTPPSAAGDLVAPEDGGSVVEPRRLVRDASGFAVEVALPEEAGTYRLIPTLHDADGTPFDAATQALLSSLAVRVTAPVDGIVTVPPTLAAATGERLVVPIQATNLGREPWGHVAIPPTRGRDDGVPATAASLVAHWLSLDDAPGPMSAAGGDGSVDGRVDLPPGLAPNAAMAAASLELVAPTVPGAYLLVIDVVVPGSGSLIALGRPPTLVRVQVGAAGPAAPVPSARVPPTPPASMPAASRPR